MFHRTNYDFSKHVGEVMEWKSVRFACRGVKAPLGCKSVVWLSSELEEFGQYTLVFEWTENQKRKMVHNNVGEDTITGLPKVWTAFPFYEGDKVKILRQRKDGVIVGKVV